MSRPQKSWPRIHKQPNRKNDSFTYYVDLGLVEGKRKRAGFPTLREAETYAEQARILKRNEGLKALALPQDVRLDAAKAHSILQPHDVSILEAAKYYQKHVLAYKSAPTVRETVGRYLADAKRRNCRPRTVQDLEQRLNALAEDFGEKRLSEIALDELQDWINDEEWEPRTRINYLTKVSQLFIFALRQNWVDSNITEKISRPSVDETKPEVFTADEAETLLKNSHQFGLLPYVAIGLFAGVRSAEMMRLKGSALNFEEKIITIGADVAKKRSQRNVDMQDTLLAWLEPYKERLQTSSSIVDAARFRRDKELLLEASGIQSWKPNGLRHSFGSYHFAKFRNSDETAYQMGNSVDVVHKHYKALVTRSDAERFWGLRPDAH